MEEAATTLSNREAELANECEKDTVLQEARNVCEIDLEPEDDLSAAERHSAETTETEGHLNRVGELQGHIADIKARKKRGPKTMTPNQLGDIEKADQHVDAYFETVARGYLLRHVRECADL